MRKIAPFIVILIVLSLFAGCSTALNNEETTTAKPEPGPEVGKWYGEVNLNQLDLSDEDRVIVSLLAGNVAYEMEAEFFEDNTYSYVMNMDKFKEGIQNSANTILGYFMKFNIDLFVDRIVELVLDSMGASERSSYGTYSVDENGLITAVGSDTQYFNFSSGTLHQLDEDGQVILTFSKTP